MKILIDTNILLDYLLKREPHFYDAEMLFRLIQSGVFDASINTSSISDIAYILKKSGIDQDVIFRLFHDLQRVTTLIPTTKTTLNNVILNKPTDMEDGLLEHSALENHIEAIVTRDVHGFTWLPRINANALVTKYFTRLVDGIHLI
jgi:predicted nucleic acid-binding protein